MDGPAAAIPNPAGSTHTSIPLPDIVSSHWVLPSLLPGDAIVNHWVTSIAPSSPRPAEQSQRAAAQFGAKFTLSAIAPNVPPYGTQGPLHDASFPPMQECQAFYEPGAQHCMQEVFQIGDGSPGAAAAAAVSTAAAAAAGLGGQQDLPLEHAITAPLNEYMGVFASTAEIAGSVNSPLMPHRVATDETIMPGAAASAETAVAAAQTHVLCGKYSGPKMEMTGPFKTPMLKMQGLNLLQQYAVPCKVAGNAHESRVHETR